MNLTHPLQSVETARQTDFHRAGWQFDSLGDGKSYHTGQIEVDALTVAPQLHAAGLQDDM